MLHVVLVADCDTGVLREYFESHLRSRGQARTHQFRLKRFIFYVEGRKESLSSTRSHMVTSRLATRHVSGDGPHERSWSRSRRP